MAENVSGVLSVCDQSPSMGHWWVGFFLHN